jgi:hypothetical protein
MTQVINPTRPPLAFYVATPQTSRFPATIAIAILGVGLSTLIGDTPNEWNSLFRSLLWFITTYVGARHFLRQPSPSSWFVIMYLVSFSSWTAFYAIGKLFFDDTTSFVVIASRSPEVGFTVDRGYYIFFCIVLAIINASGVVTASDQLPKSNTIDHTGYRLLPLLALTLFGSSISVIGRFAPGSLAQPLFILSSLFTSGIAIMCIYSPAMKSEKANLLKFLLPITCVVCFGIFGFASSGFKGKLYISLLQLGWLIAYCQPKHRKILTTLGLLLGLSFIILLPAFHKVKKSANVGNSATDNLAVFMNAIFESNASKSSTGVSRIIDPEHTWLYLSLRLCTATMSHTFYNRYGEEPRGLESLWVSLSAAIPRVFDSNKISTSEYYNSISIESGVGDRNDKKTQRKPPFVDEVLIIWGWKGYIIGGFLFGFYLVGVEWLLSKIAFDVRTLTVLKFSLVDLGMVPYIGTIIGGIVYLLLATVLLYRQYLRIVLENEEQVLLKVAQSLRPR